MSNHIFSQLGPSSGGVGFWGLREFRVPGTRKKPFRTPQIGGVEFSFFQKLVLRDFAQLLRFFRYIEYELNSDQIELIKVTCRCNLEECKYSILSKWKWVAGLRRTVWEPGPCDTTGGSGVHNDGWSLADLLTTCASSFSTLGQKMHDRLCIASENVFQIRYKQYRKVGLCCANQKKCFIQFCIISFSVEKMSYTLHIIYRPYALRQPSRSYTNFSQRSCRDPLRASTTLFLFIFSKNNLLINMLILFSSLHVNFPGDKNPCHTVKNCFLHPEQNQKCILHFLKWSDKS